MFITANAIFTTYFEKIIKQSFKPISQFVTGTSASDTDILQNIS